MKIYQLLLSVIGIGLLVASLAACRPLVASSTSAPSATLDVRTPAVATVSVALPTPTLAPDLLPTAAPTLEPTPSPMPSPTPGFVVGNELTIAALLQHSVEGSAITIEQQLENGANYARYIASYLSEGNKIYGLLTVPLGDPPEGGHKAIVFIHGYIPPDQYRTIERYVAYVDALAQAGFVVFKIDLRGFGESEGEPTGAYFSPDYSIDAIAALKSLQALDYVDPEGIGLWGHSMAGNVTLRAMLIEPAIQAGVIWAGAVYSYDDFTRYSIDDPSYSPTAPVTSAGRRRGQLIRETYGPPNTTEPFWRAVSLTEHIDLLRAPLQLHHAIDDNVVTIDYSRDLAGVLNVAGKTYEFYEYEGGGHNITSPYFGEAMRRTIAFFQENL
jgi:fermentation-respiration switch protein FrsA (DUF1100 family)